MAGEILSCCINQLFVSHITTLVVNLSMEFTKRSSILIILLVFVSSLIEANAYYYRQCSTKGTRCYGKYIRCPAECPSSESNDPKAKVCYIDCDKPICKAVCRRKINHTFINFSPFSY